MEVTAKYKIPHFFAMGATGVVNEKFKSDQAKYGYWTTKGWPDPAKLTIGYVQAIEDAIAAGSFKPAEKKVAIYGEDTDWGRSFGKGLKDQLGAVGWTVVSEDYFPTTQTDFSAIVSRYSNDNVPLIAGHDDDPRLDRLVPQGRRRLRDQVTRRGRRPRLDRRLVQAQRIGVGLRGRPDPAVRVRSRQEVRGRLRGQVRQQAEPVGRPACPTTSPTTSSRS